HDVVAGPVGVELAERWRRAGVRIAIDVGQDVAEMNRRQSDIHHAQGNERPRPPLGAYGQRPSEEPGSLGPFGLAVHRPVSYAPRDHARTLARRLESGKNRNGELSCISEIR